MVGPPAVAVPPEVPPSFLAMVAKSGQIKPRMYFPLMAMVRFPTLPPLMLPSVTTKVPAALFTWVTMPI